MRTELGEQRATEALEERALEDIAFLRETMARASLFRQLPGLGMILMGMISLAGCYVASWRLSYDWWVNVWGMVGFVGWLAGVVAMTLKGRGAAIAWWRGPGRKAAEGFAPAVVVGLLLTEFLFELGEMRLMAGLWAMLYGLAMCGAAPFTVGPLRALGVAFIVMGCGYYSLLVWGNALGSGTIWGMPTGYYGLQGEDVFLALTFGGLHILAGIYVALRHGG